jgi:hypothetical protein
MTSPGDSGVRVAVSPFTRVPFALFKSRTMNWPPSIPTVA